MEYQKIINLLDNTQKNPSKFRTKHRVGINDDARGTYNSNSQIKFKTSMLKPNLCDYSDTYTLAEKDFISLIDRGVGLSMTVLGANWDLPSWNAHSLKFLEKFVAKSCIDCRCVFQKLEFERSEFFWEPSQQI